MIQIQNLKLKLTDDLSVLEEKIRKRLKLRFPVKYTILRRSIDARDKNDILLVFHVAVEVSNEQSLLNKKIKGVSEYTPNSYPILWKTRKERIAVVGYGPAGIFSALCLQEAGFHVEVFERGKPVDDRQVDVDLFWDQQVLDENSNVQFGEGGAGTFSDGKLTNRSNNRRNIKLFEEFVEASAPEDILYVNNPHVGTDLLKNVIKNIRNKFLSLGGIIHFSTKVEKLIIDSGKCKGVVTDTEHYFDDVILAVGHSARDTFRTLYEQGVQMNAKPFAVGFRIEHLQSMINHCQYGDNYDNPRLGVAEYKLVHQTEKRGVYTFCMSPGGLVIPAQSEKQTVVVNGMSYHSRGLTNANAAVLVTVDDEDYGKGVFAGVEFQERIEKEAYIRGGSNYSAPVQTVRGYLSDSVYTLHDVIPSYPIGTKLTSLRGLYPKGVEEALCEGLIAMDKKIPGFASNGAVLTGVETRSSSPIRMLRDKETMESNIKYLYPIGEGCGYAGGIVSAAVDGIRCFEQILRKYDE